MGERSGQVGARRRQPLVEKCVQDPANDSAPPCPGAAEHHHDQQRQREVGAGELRRRAADHEHVDHGVLATAGGTVVATRTGGQAFLTSWSPAQGYEADHVSRGPAPTASIRFRTGKGRGIRLSVTCPDNVPTGANTDD